MTSRRTEYTGQYGVWYHSARHAVDILMMWNGEKYETTDTDPCDGEDCTMEDFPYRMTTADLNTHIEREEE